MPSPRPGPSRADADPPARADATGRRACWLDPRDDVATALVDLPRATRLQLRCGDAIRDVTLRDPIATGHKFAVATHPAGVRIRKYGEYIGALRDAVAAGAWVHEHNLVTSARRVAADEAAWRAQASIAATAIACDAGSPHAASAPVYDAGTGRLCWIDGDDGRALGGCDLERNATHRWPLPSAVDAMLVADDGALVASGREGSLALAPAAWNDAGAVPVACPLPPSRALHCDARGRLFAVVAHGEAQQGALRMLENGDWITLVDDLTLPCAVATSAGADTLYVVEAPRARVQAVDIAGRLGTTRARVVAELAAYPGEPRGAAVDAGGNLWTVLTDAGYVVCIDAGGRLARVLRLASHAPTACVFGGAGHARLFVTTSPHTAPGGALEPAAGHVLALDVGARGFAQRRWTPPPDLGRAAR